MVRSDRSLSEFHPVDVTILVSQNGDRWTQSFLGVLTGKATDPYAPLAAIPAQA